MTGPRIIQFRGRPDERGFINVCEFGQELPFAIKRFFILAAGVREVKRGGYAQQRQSELMVAIMGTTTVRVDGRGGPRSFVLLSPGCGLLVPPMTWCEVTIARRSELLVMASDVYKPDEHIHDIPTFEEAHASA